MDELTHEELVKVVKLATTSTAESSVRWEERASIGLSDKKLSEAIRYELGIAGGSCGSSIGISVSYQGAGLKIWASKGSSHNTCLDKPVLSSGATLALVRKVYKICDPENDQMTLF